MSKTAILAFHAPESCAECRLEYGGHGIGTPYCMAIGAGFQTFTITEKYTNDRAPFCPLRIVEGAGGGGGKGSAKTKDSDFR